MSEGLWLSISARAENRRDDRGCIHRSLSRISLFFWLRDHLGQLATALLTINKHWAPLVFHGRTPFVSVVSYLILFSRGVMGWVNKVGEKNQG
jgi:hypothetical protein